MVDLYNMETATLILTKEEIEQEGNGSVAGEDELIIEGEDAHRPAKEVVELAHLEDAVRMADRGQRHEGRAHEHEDAEGK